MNQRTATPEELKLCLQITEKLIKHPISKMFLRPVDPIADSAPDYELIIRNPQDLGTIKQRLEDKTYYKYISDWDRDMSLIWKNCIQYNGEKSYFAAVARGFKDLYEKMSKPIKIKNYEGWILRINELFENIDTLLKKSPNSIQQNFASKLLTPGINKESMTKCISAAEKLTSPDDILHIIQIALLNGASYAQNNSEGELTLMSMNKTGMRQLMQYTKERYGSNLPLST